MQAATTGSEKAAERRGALFFCNIGWMSRYEGLSGKPDKIVGGGSYVAENATGGEVCNFAAGDVRFSVSLMSIATRILAAGFKDSLVP